MKVVPVRMKDEEIAALTGWARLHSRNVSSEIRLAVRVLLRMHMLHHLETPEGRADVKQQGLDPRTEKAWLQEDLKRLTEEAFAPAAPEPPHPFTSIRQPEKALN